MWCFPVAPLECTDRQPVAERCWKQGGRSELVFGEENWELHARRFLTKNSSWDVTFAFSTTEVFKLHRLHSQQSQNTQKSTIHSNKWGWFSPWRQEVRMSFSPALWDVSIPRVSHLSEERLPAWDSFRLIPTGKRSDAPQNDVPDSSLIIMSVIMSTGWSKKHSFFFSLHALCVSYWSVETDTYNTYVPFE